MAFLIKLFQNQKGLTVVELMIVLALLMLVLSLGFNLLFFGNQAYTRSSSQQIVQSNVRFASNSIIELVKYSVSIEILNEKPDILEDPYNYLYLDNNQLIMSYISPDGDRLERVLNSEINSVEFWDASADKELLGLSITGTENDQSYEIEQEIALFNYSLEQQNLSFTDSTSSGIGTAIKFIKDVELIPLDQTNTLRLNREADFELYPDESFEFMANMEVTWLSNDPGVITIDSDGLATAVGGEGQSATITATSTEDLTLSKSVVITIVDRKDYYVTITDSDYNPIVGNLNIVKDTEETIHAVISPALDDMYTISDVDWFTPHEDDQNYITLVPTDEDTTIGVEGVAVGKDANLTVRITLEDSDGGTFDLPEDSIIVNVMEEVQYAKINSITLPQTGAASSVSLEPSFQHDHTEYKINGSGDRTISFNVSTGVTVSTREGSGGSWVDLNSPYSVTYNLAHNVNFYVRVSEQGKLDRVYHFTN